MQCIYHVEKRGGNHSKSHFEQGGRKIVKFAVTDINTGYNVSQILMGYGCELTPTGVGYTSNYEGLSFFTSELNTDNNSLTCIL